MMINVLFKCKRVKTSPSKWVKLCKTTLKRVKYGFTKPLQKYRLSSIQLLKRVEFHSFGVVLQNFTVLEHKVFIPIGAMDKYNIYLFISNSMDDFKSSQYWNFQVILPRRFSYEVFCEQHHLQSVPLATVLCIYWSRLWKIQDARNIYIPSKVNQSGT